MLNTFIKGAAVASGALATALALTLAPSPAHACGGFFCNNTQPVNQAAERIIFSHAPDGTVTAVIQIQYSGPSESFAWMLPVNGTPEVSVSSDAAFQRLQQATNPFYQLTTTVNGTCADDFSRSRGPAPSAGFSDAGVATDGGGSEVSVVDRGAVGPYDYVVISVDMTASDRAAVAIAWLQDNGYDVDDFGGDLLRPYLDGGMNLLAFRLTKGNDAGSIRPVMITFGNGLPSIPIRPTAVAATDDMGVMVWVLGEHRAVPENYRSLELNEALINWLNPNANYNDVVTRAANEAGGQGFVTEMAGQASPLADMIFQSWEEDQWRTIESSDWTGREGELLNAVANTFSFLDGMRDALGATVPLPPGVTLEQLLGCITCYYNYSETDIAGFEPADFVAAVAEHVIDPMTRTAALFESRPYMTRLYTTMSADEMTMDPVFNFNPDLPEYSNNHNAERTVYCYEDVLQSEAPWKVTLPDGQVVRGAGTNWPFSIEDEDMPANARIRRVGTSGEGEVIEDNTGAISAALRDHNETYTGSRGLCAASGSLPADGGAAALGLALLGLLGLSIARRRK